MEPRIIKSEAQYRTYLGEVERLAVLDPVPESPEGERLELLSVLIEDYEQKRYEIPLPNPVDAIVFRMEEQGLRQKDLVPLIGSKSKVSEVLAGKRKLTLNMVRALSSGLGIPVKSLLSGTETSGGPENQPEDFSRFPFREMARRGWLGETVDLSSENLVERVREFFSQVGGQGIGPAYFRRTMHMGGDVAADAYAINAWLARVLVKSRELPVDKVAGLDDVDPKTLLREIAQLSWSERGPVLAREFLSQRGIALVIERHLPRTRLDGASLLDIDGTPVVGMTLRYDRIDNFWFTLLHEVAHVICHIKGKNDAFVDNTEDDPDGEQKEVEANSLAREALIPRSVWRRSDAYRRPSVETINELARELRIHPAIVAGRIRRETNNYRRFGKLVGQGKVSVLFSL